MESFTGLAISYNGHYIRHDPKKKSSIKGAVLIDSGQVYARDHQGLRWNQIRTPESFYFYDNHSEVTYIINSKKKSIKSTVPEGRILDCTDQVIYDIINGAWCPIYDLSNKSTSTVVKYTHLPGDDNEDDCFEIVGSPITILKESTDIYDKDVNLDAGLLRKKTVSPGQSKVLIYKTRLSDNEIIVTHLFSRGTLRPHFSVVGGQLQLKSIEAHIPIHDIPSCLSPISNNMHPLINWKQLNDNLEAADLVSGTWTVPKSGDYQVSAQVNFFSSIPIIESDTKPWIALIKYNSSNNEGLVLASAPINANQASFNIGLNLLREDCLILYYLEDTISPRLPNYQTITCATSFNAYYISE